jgi:hypothetical protein
MNFFTMLSFLRPLCDTAAIQAAKLPGKPRMRVRASVKTWEVARRKSNMPALAQGEIDRPDAVIHLCSQRDLKLQALACSREERRSSINRLE